MVAMPCACHDLMVKDATIPSGVQKVRTMS